VYCTDLAYTDRVTRATFIHLLLAALLCFGQITANGHGVGHIHQQVSEHAAHASVSTFGSRHALAQSEHIHVEDDESDCAIYHAHSNLSGVFFAAPDQVVVFSNHGLKAKVQLIDLGGVTAEYQPIRGPPIFS